MSIQKRGNTYYLCLYRGGVEIRRSLKTTDKAEAELRHAELVKQIWREQELGEKPVKSWKEAVVSWVEHSRKRSLSDDIQKIAMLDEHLSKLTLDQIDKDLWDGVLVSLRKTRGLKDTTCNRYTALVKAILRQHGFRPELRKYAETRRGRYMTTAEAQSAYLALPGWAQAPYLFALATGLRRANVLGLSWGQIDMQRRVIQIKAEDFKQGRAVEVPLSSEAIAILKAQLGKHLTSVFTREGKPIKKAELRYFWDKAKPEGVRWHDIRKTWASWLRQAGVSLGDIKEAGGWSSMQIVESTYAHVRPTQLVEDVDRLNGAIAGIASQLPHISPDFKKAGTG